ncbi:retrovirus-related pol polyprotein from transposon TNT 1-94 [Tanacetum coccineum]
MLIRNVGNDGRIVRRSYNVQEETTKGSNVQKETENVQKNLRTYSFGNVTNVQCYNFNEKGHYARNCPKPRFWDSKYFIKQMLLAKKDEACIILSNEQNDFPLADATQMPSYDSAFISEILELQNAQTVLKRQMNANEDKYLDDVLNLEAKLKTNKNVVIKMSQSMQAMFMLGPKPLSFYDPKLKHSLGYKILIRSVISQNLKLYDASTFKSSKVHVNVRNTKEILKEATKSQIKMENKLKDPIVIEKKQNFQITNYKKLNALYENFVPQVELSAEHKYFSSTSITSETTSNASTSTSPPAKMPNSNELMQYF